MIARSAFRSIQTVIWYICLLKIAPYNWDSETCRLVTLTKWRHRLLHWIHSFTTYGLTIFAGLRFLNALSNDKANTGQLTPRVAAMNILWGLAYLMSSVCFYQFTFKSEDILCFANTLLGHIKKVKGKGYAGWKDKKFKKDLFSKIVVLSGIMLFINPPFHSIMMLDTPCAPHFSSSIWLSCNHVEEDSHPLSHKLIFMLLETYFAFLIFSPLSFCWTFIYAGLGWIRTENRELREMMRNPATCGTQIIRKYRSISLISGLLNDSFYYYLEWFPTILLGIVSFLLYACINFVHVGWRAYAMFPSCLFRCSFESFTPLFLAGKVNQECILFLKEFRGAMGFSHIHLHEEQDVKGRGAQLNLQKSWYASCRVFDCKAGGMYAFENSIFFKSVGNCILLTLNLLLLGEM